MPPSSPRLGEPVEIEAVVLGNVEVTEAKIFHRTVGQTGYHEVRMSFRGGSWSAKIPSEFVSPSGVEYALVFHLADGSSLAFPQEDPLDSPYKLLIKAAVEPRRTFGEEGRIVGTQLTADVLIIAPEEGQLVPVTNILIVASFFNVQALDVRSVKLFLDNRNVTSEAVISPEILTYSPLSLEPGLHTVKIEFRNTFGYELQPVSWSFTVAGRGREIVTASDEFQYSGGIRSNVSFDQVENRPRRIGQTITRFKGGWRWLSFRTDVRVTTDESEFRQPRNRYSATLKSGDNITIYLGDFTPAFSPYTIDGKRVRGIGIDVDLNWIRFQMVNGEIERAVQGLLDMDRSYMVTEIKVDSLEGKLVPTYVLDRRGYTFRREVQSYRFGFNFRNRFQLGLNLQKAKDQISSVRKELVQAKLFVPYDTLLTVSQIDSGVYTFDEIRQKKLEGVVNYELADKNWGGDNPYDNVVFGFDAGLSFDDRRLTFETSWAMSLMNKNIWDGAMTRTGLDTILDDSTDGFVGRMYDEEGAVTDSGFSLEKMPDPSTFEDFFTVNQYMTPLIPIDLEAYGETPLAAIMNMPSAAYKFKMRAYYYNNTFQMQYSQVGPEFKSLANPYLSSNLREFTISDRMRLIDNKMSVSFDYKHRDNSILKSIVDRYAQNSLSANFMFAPGFDLPSFSTGFQSITRSNGKTELDTLVTGEDSFSLEDRRENTRTRNQMFSINIPWRYRDLTGNFLGTLSSVNVSDLLQAERAMDYSSPDMSSRSFSLVTAIKYSFPLRISVNISGYSVQLPATVTSGQNESRLRNVGIDATYDTWGNRLKLRGGLSFSMASGISKFAYYGIKSGAEFKPMRSFQAKLTVSAKIRQTEDEVRLGTLAVKFSANYVF